MSQSSYLTSEIQNTVDTLSGYTDIKASLRKSLVKLGIGVSHSYLWLAA